MIVYINYKSFMCPCNFPWIEKSSCLWETLYWKSGY